MTWKVKFANKQKYCTTIYYMFMLCYAGDQQIKTFKTNIECYKDNYYC